MPWDGAHDDFKGCVGYSAEGRCQLSYVEVAPCYETQNPCLQTWGEMSSPPASLAGEKALGTAFSSLPAFCAAPASAMAGK